MGARKSPCQTGTSREVAESRLCFPVGSHRRHCGVPCPPSFDSKAKPTVSDLHVRPGTKLVVTAHHPDNLLAVFRPNPVHVENTQCFGGGFQRSIRSTLICVSPVLSNHVLKKTIVKELVDLLDLTCSHRVSDYPHVGWLVDRDFFGRSGRIKGVKPRRSERLAFFGPKSPLPSFAHPPEMGTRKAMKPESTFVTHLFNLP
jgi:hypothetical protein